MLKTTIGRLRAIGVLEGSSFLLLLFVAMPLKYLAGMPGMVSVVGMAHGVLFILYCIAVLQAAFDREWPFSRIALAFVAAVLPFGPFVFDKRILRDEDASGAAEAA